MVRRTRTHLVAHWMSPVLGLVILLSPVTGFAASASSRSASGDEIRELERTVKDRKTGDEIAVGVFWDEPRAFMALRDDVVSQRDPSASSTHYLGITVQSQTDKRVVPGARVEVSWKTSRNDSSETITVPFVWSPQFNHYGANIALAKETTSVVLTVSVLPPTFLRGEIKPEPFFSKPEVFTITTSVPTASKPVSTRKTPQPTVPAGTPRPLEGRYKRIVPTPYPGSETTATITPAPSKPARRKPRPTPDTSAPVPNYLLPR